MNVMGIETSCDETAVSVVRDGHEIVVNEVFTQEVHKNFGGVVPEVASRNHVVKMFDVLEAALQKSGLTLNDIDCFAATQGPGLIGALLIGLNTAKTLAYALNKPLVPVNHIEAHLFANILAHRNPQPPFLGLIVSGGHTTFLRVDDYHRYSLIGQTQDDAIGEAYDKVAKLIGLGYPGGPIIDKLAKEGNERAVEFTLPQLKSSPYDFSFSGLKTAVRMFHEKNPDINKADLVASFQYMAVKTVTSRIERYFTEHEVLPLAVAGGVAANSRLRSACEELCMKYNTPCYIPPLKLCTDNAAMVASLGYFLFQKGCTVTGKELLTLNAKASMPIF